MYLVWSTFASLFFVLHFLLLFTPFFHYLYYLSLLLHHRYSSLSYQLRFLYLLLLKWKLPLATLIRHSYLNCLSLESKVRISISERGHTAFPYIKMYYITWYFLPRSIYFPKISIISFF